MGKQPLFTNPVIQSPWTSAAPKTIAVRKKLKIERKEDHIHIHKHLNNISLFSLNFPYQKLGFHAHRGRYHAFYKSVKLELKEAPGRLIKSQLTPTPITTPQNLQHHQIRSQVEYKLQSQPKLQQCVMPSSMTSLCPPSVEVINIPDDVIDANKGENVMKYGRSVGRKQKSPKMYIKIAAKPTNDQSDLEKLKK